MLIARGEPELGPGDLEHARIQLQDGLPSRGMHRLEVPREREPAPADVQDIRRPTKPGPQRGRRVGEAPDIPEPEIRRVAQVDCGVGEVVEHEDPDVRVRSGPW